MQLKQTLLQTRSLPAVLSLQFNMRFFQLMESLHQLFSLLRCQVEPLLVNRFLVSAMLVKLSSSPCGDAWVRRFFEFNASCWT